MPTGDRALRPETGPLIKSDLSHERTLIRCGQGNWGKDLETADRTGLVRGSAAAVIARRENGPIPVIKVLLVLLCLVLPFLAVLLKDGPSLKVLWAFLLQLCGHIPGVIYGIYQVVKD
jgi:uncharacterized membrane protein YqaE (UPF0057 family)